MVCWEQYKKTQGGIEGQCIDVKISIHVQIEGQCIDVFILKINGMLGIR